MSKNLNLIEASKEFSVQAGDVTISNVTLDDTVSLDSNVDISANIKSTLNASGDAPIYACRAWVNFDGTFGTSPFTEENGGIRASGNVSSVTDNGTGNYTVNFTTAMPDEKYSLLITCDQSNVLGGAVGGHNAYGSGGSPPGLTSSSARVYGIDAGTNSYSNLTTLSVAIFR